MTGRNERCRCGSGKKFKHCCAAPVRTLPTGVPLAEAIALATRLHQAGDYAQAEVHYRQILARDPGNARVSHFLGMCLFQAGREAEAVIAFEQAIRLNPADDAVHNNLGFARLQRGEPLLAVAHFRRAAGLNPANASAHANLGNALRALGDIPGSIASHRRAVDVDGTNAQAQFDLGRALLHDGQAAAALPHLRAVLRLAPAAAGGWRWLADALAQLRFAVFDPGIAEELADCLERADIEPAYLAPAAISLLRAEPGFAALLRTAKGAAPADFFDAAMVRAASQPLFLRMLENCFIADGEFETLIVRLRCAVAFAWQADTLDRADDLLAEVIAAIAHQCFLCEYLPAESAQESSLVDALATALESALVQPTPTPPQALEIALFAAYRPLRSLSGSHSLRGTGATRFGRLVIRQVWEPTEEAAIADQLETLTPIVDPVSRQVRDQYEENPYPRWLRAPSAEGGARLADRLGSLFPDAGKARMMPARPSILIAGCGSGRQAAMAAALDPDSPILAIDLSRASLAYAGRRARESGLSNIRFAQADILELGGLGQRFDVIQCSGVLHHLRDPIAGWRVLCGLLAPRGLMKVALYSEAARASVEAARALIAARGFGADIGGIRAARTAILALPLDHPARKVAASIDFNSRSGCRDLLFHVQEHRYTLPAIANMLDALELRFLGFEFEFDLPMVQYRREFPGDPSATSLQNWAEFEVRHVDTFAAMYQFWVTPKG